MRINQEQKTLDIERRDWNYIMPAYIRSYLFFSKNEDPEKIIFPMFRDVKHPLSGKLIPVEYVPEDSPVAIEITEDGSNVPEATEEQIAEADRKDEEIKKLKEEVKRLSDGGPEEPLTPAQTEAKATERPPIDKAFTPPALAPDREPNKPTIVIPPGQPLDNMSPRNKGDQRRVARDLRQEPDVDESKEKPIEIDKPKEQ